MSTYTLVDPYRRAARRRKTQRIRLGTATSQVVVAGVTSMPLTRGGLDSLIVITWIAMLVLAATMSLATVWIRRNDPGGGHSLDLVVRYVVATAVAGLPIAALATDAVNETAFGLAAALGFSTAFITITGMQYHRRLRLFTSLLIGHGAVYSIVFTVANEPRFVVFCALWTANLVYVLRHAAISRDELGAISDAALRSSHTDSLTGVLTRAGLIALWRERPSKVPGSLRSLVVFDVARFRDVNNEHGHGFGDQVLREIARRLVHVFVDHGVVARLSSDRFVVLINDQPTEQQSHELITAAHRAVERPYRVDGSKVQLRIRAGCTDLWVTEDFPTGIDDAERALRVAVEQNRSIEHCDDVMRQKRDRELSIQKRVPRALAAGELTFWGQPIVHASTGQPIAVELLGRWPQSDGSLISPGEFLPALASLGLLDELGRSAMRTASSWLHQWRDDPELGAISATLNVTPGHLATSMREDLRRQFDQRDMHRLGVEMVETEFIEHTERLRVQLEGVRDLGVQVLVDDFGAGYSALSLLAELPFTTLKLDRSLVHLVHREPRRLDLVRAVLATAKAMGLHVIAEGVESELERDVLETLGVRLVQGWFAARAQPLERLEFELRRMQRDAKMRDPAAVAKVTAAMRESQAQRSATGTRAPLTLPLDWSDAELPS